MFFGYSLTAQKQGEIRAKLDALALAEAGGAAGVESMGGGVGETPAPAE